MGYTIFGPKSLGTVTINAGKTSGWIFADNLLGEYERGTWTITVIPLGRDPDTGVPPEADLEVVDTSILRKDGKPPEAPQDANKLQIRYRVRNNGRNKATGEVWVTGIRPKP